MSQIAGHKNSTALKDAYPSDTDDVVFLRDMKDGKYDVFISNNTEQRRIPDEKKALQRGWRHLAVFQSILGQDAFWDQATWIVKKWPQIEGFCRGTAKGTCADLQQNGTARYFQCSANCPVNRASIENVAPAQTGRRHSISRPPKIRSPPLCFPRTEAGPRLGGADSLISCRRVRESEAGPIPPVSA